MRVLSFGSSLLFLIKSWIKYSHALTSCLIVSSIFEGYKWSAADFIGLLLVIFGNVLVMTKKPSKILKYSNNDAADKRL